MLLSISIVLMLLTILNHVIALDFRRKYHQLLLGHGGQRIDLRPYLIL